MRLASGSREVRVPMLNQGTEDAHTGFSLATVANHLYPALDEEGARSGLVAIWKGTPGREMAATPVHLIAKLKLVLAIARSVPITLGPSKRVI